MNKQVVYYIYNLVTTLFGNRLIFGNKAYKHHFHSWFLCYMLSTFCEYFQNQSKNVKTNKKSFQKLVFVF